MNTFGLGLILNFTDNASAGMQRATQTFNEMNRVSDQLVSSSTSVGNSLQTLSIAGYGLSVAGSSLASAGNSIVSLFTDASQKIISTGLELESFQRQLNMLYGSEEKGQNALNRIKDYAQESVFGVQDLTQAVITMKAVGIEALDEVTTSVGGQSQKLIQYAADIAAMFPNMRNAYGTGVNAAMGAMKEYIAEGNARSLKSGAGLDITEILGEDKGKSIAERTQQIADLVEKMGIFGYTAQLAGTPAQQLEKIQDSLYNTMGRIAKDGGLIDVYSSALRKLAVYIDGVYNDEEKMTKITNIVGGALRSLIEPLSKAIDYVIKFADSLIDFLDAHPILAETIIKITAIAGAVMFAGGKLLQFSGTTLTALSSLMMLVKGVGGSASIFSAIKVVISSLASKLLPLAAIAGVVYFAWKNNLFGLQDVVKSTFEKVGKVISLVVDAWNDNTLDYDSWVEAKELGVLPLIESILTLKYYWDFFKEGFKQGLSDFKQSLVDTLNQFQLMGIDVFGLTEKLGIFLQSLTDTGQEETWTNIGHSLGEVAGALIAIVAILPVLKGISTVVSAVTKIFSFIGKIAKVVAKIVTPVKFLISKIKDIGAFFALVKENGLAATLQGLGSTGGGVFAVISGALVAFINFFSMLKNGFSWLKEALMVVGIAVAAIGAIILGAPAAIAAGIAAAVALVLTGIVLIKEHWNEICEWFKTTFTAIGDWFKSVGESIANWFRGVVDSVKNWFVSVGDFFKGIGEWINTNVIQPVSDFFKTVWSAITGFVSKVIAKAQEIATGIYNKVIAPVVNFFTTYIFPIIAKIAEIVAKIVEIIVTLIRVGVQWIWGRITSFISLVVEKVVAFAQAINTNIIQPVIQWVMGVVDRIKQFVSDVISWIGTAIETVKSVIYTIIEWINTNIIQPIITLVTNVISTIQQALSAAVSWIYNTVIVPIITFVTNLISTILGWIETLKAGLITVASWINENVIQPILNFFTNMWNTIKTTFTNIVTRIGDAVSGAIKSAVNTALGFVTRVINGVISAINGAIGIINKIPGVSISTIAPLNLPALAEGGIVDRPILAEVGEDGPEAVVPLKNNTEWISGLAKELNNQKNVTNAPNNSVVFESGSVVIQIQGTTDDDLEEVADRLMKMIARKQQIQNMAIRT